MTLRNIKKIKTAATILVCATAVILLLQGLDAAVRPILREEAAAKADIMLTRLINDTVTLSLDGVDIVRTEVDSSGALTALRLDTAAMNRIKSDVVEKVTSAISTPDTAKVEVPVGTLTGLDMLAGKGAAIPVKVVLVQTVSANYITEFVGAGLNQTVHRVTLEVVAEICLLMPTQTVRRTVKTQVVAAETVIVGSVPFNR